MKTISGDKIASFVYKTLMKGNTINIVLTLSCSSQLVWNTNVSTKQKKVKVKKGLNKIAYLSTYKAHYAALFNINL